MWARSCPTTRSRTSTRAHYGLSRGYRNRRAVTAGRARATTASSKATQLLYGSSLGLGLWPLDCSAHDVPCSAAHPSSRSQDRTVRQRPRQRAAGAGPCATRLEVHNTTASSEASSASLSVSAPLSTALLRHSIYCRRSTHHGGWQASGRLSLRRLRRPSHSAAHECNACERVH